MPPGTEKISNVKKRSITSVAEKGDMLSCSMTRPLARGSIQTVDVGEKIGRTLLLTPFT
jgi:hypothetical protein